MLFRVACALSAATALYSTSGHIHKWSGMRKDSNERSSERILTPRTPVQNLISRDLTGDPRRKDRSIVEFDPKAHSSRGKLPIAVKSVAAMEEAESRFSGIPCRGERLVTLLLEMCSSARDKPCSNVRSAKLVLLRFSDLRLRNSRN